MFLVHVIYIIQLLSEFSFTFDCRIPFFNSFFIIFLGFRPIRGQFDLHMASFQAA